MSAIPTRRQFLQHATEALTLATALNSLGAVHTFGAEAPAVVRLGIIGCGGIMGSHVKGLVGRRRGRFHRMAVRRRSAPDRQNGWLHVGVSIGPGQADLPVRGRPRRQGRRCLHRRHSAPLARTDRDQGHAGRQRCLYREANLARLY